ncbi:hypothetical protein ACQ4PT_056088 [Festuca glaucescens]
MQRSSTAMVRKLAEESLHTVVFLSIWGGGAGVGEWRERRRPRRRNVSQQSRGRTSNLHPLVFGRTWGLDQSTGLGPSIGPGPSSSSFTDMRKFAQLDSQGNHPVRVAHVLLVRVADLVYCLLHKAKGFSVDSHPVVQTFVEISFFLKKVCACACGTMEYQIQKLTNAADTVAVQDKVPDAEVNGKGEQHAKEHLLRYRLNLDMIDTKLASDGQDNVDIYHPLKLQPVIMDDKRSKYASGREKALARMATQIPSVKEIIDAAADRTEEVTYKA